MFPVSHSFRWTIPDNFDAFSLAFDRRAVRTYTLPPLKGQFKKIADDLKAEINNPKYTMIGKNIEILGDAFAASRSNGKIWQIWAGSTSKN